LRMEASAGGHTVRELERVPPLPGSQLQLTIDIKLQQMVESLFGERRGALVALQPKTGEVLAMVSMPSFDPNLFIDGIDVASWKGLNESLDRPLLNRALNGTYPPGSTYKPFMALLALRSGKRTAQTVIQDPGYWMLGSHKFRSHGDIALGPVNLYKSIVESSNIYYYSLAYDLGVDAIHDFMAPFGFGQLTGIDLTGETKGLLPNKAWKASAFKRPSLGTWIPGDTISLGIGQGFNSFTVLQLATATSGIANGGYRITPHLVQAEGDEHPEKPQGQALGLRAKDLQAVTQAMVGVTVEGTSRGAFANAAYTSAGKTGTAQAVTIGQTDKYDARKLAERKRDHSLYIAFAPAEDPQIAVAAVVENAGFGSTSAAPIARRVFDYWLQGLYPSEDDIAAVARGAALTPIGVARAVTDVPLAPRLATVNIDGS
jgi:penicillin-binding protein 2